MAGANDRVQVAVIGCGGMGNVLLDAFLRAEGAAVAAVCDVDASHRGAAAAKVEKRSGRRPEEFGDFRRLLDRKDVDAVVIATPDHWHAIPFILACEAGKDVYCEKPLAHNVVEGRAMVAAARRSGRVVQIGTLQRSAPHFREAIERVRSGAIGRVVETQTWNGDNVDIPEAGPPPDGEPPAGVDYDFWLGPAPKRPYNPRRFHIHWRWQFDYGGGMLTDWNVHSQDIVHLALGVDAPRSVAMAGRVERERSFREAPDTATAVYEYEAPQGAFAQTYTLRRTNAFAPAVLPFHWHHGVAFLGRAGTLFVNREGWALLPEGKGAEPRRGARSDGLDRHVADFLDCVRTRREPAAGVASLHGTTNACHLANIAWRVGRRIYWDAQNEKCFRDRELGVPDDEANALLGRTYRAPWKLPG